MKLPSKFTPPLHKLTALLAAALMALAVPAQAQWPVANLLIPSGCSADNPTFALTELYRNSVDRGVGEPSQGYGITPKGSGNVVREGANFSILYRLTACVNAFGTNVTPNARVTLDPDGNAKGWNLGATFTGHRPAASYTSTQNVVSRFGRWIERQHGNSADALVVYVLDIWVHGTTTDDNCIGTPTGSSATASVSVYLLDGDGSSQRALEITIRKEEDDTTAGRKRSCT